MKKRRIKRDTNRVRVKPKTPDNKNFYFADEVDIKFIQTGCTLLDCINGGGWAIGRMANLVGDKSTGKTLVAIEATANFSREYPKGHIIYDVGGGETFDVPYARSLGFPKTNTTILTSETVEEWYDHLTDLCFTKKEKKEPTLYVLDSLDAISDDAEKKRKFTDGTYGTKAKKVGELFRRIGSDLDKHKVALLIVSQIRDNIGVMFGKKYKRSGGKALDFYAAQVTWLAEKKKISKTVKGQKRVIGIQVVAKNEKNKVGIPYRTCEFPIMFNYGMDDTQACIDFLKETKVKHSDLDDDEMKELVIREWREIESEFMPHKGKYN